MLLRANSRKFWVAPHISKATAAISAQVNKFCFHRAIPGITLPRHVYTQFTYNILCVEWRVRSRIEGSWFKTWRL